MKLTLLLECRFVCFQAAENAERAERGEELLPETDPSLPIFKPIPDAMCVACLCAM